MIFREDYINKIRPFIDKPLIKILSGIRRSGKSTMLQMIKSELINRGTAKESIIERRYTAIGLSDISSAKEMYDNIKSEMREKKHYYLLLDEIQEIEGWEKAINNLLEEDNADIYVTGSNSKLMASEISTYLTGRYVLIPVFTLSFKEYLKFKGKNPSKDALIDYIRLGGFPLVALSDFKEPEAYQIANGIYHTVTSRDIMARHRITKQDLFDRVARYVVENVGKTFSANSISKFLKSEGRALSVETVYNYLTWLEKAFVIYPCRRFDLKGKNILKTQEKYYLADVSLKYSLMGYNRTMLDSVIENIVFLEFKRRGYEVFVGKNESKEIDFIAEKLGDRIYAQICVRLPENSDREISNLLNIPDNYPKYVITLDSLATGNVDGIRIVALESFLLTENW